MTKMWLKPPRMKVFIGLEKERRGHMFKDSIMNLTVLGSVILLAGCATQRSVTSDRSAETTYEHVQVEGQKTTTFRRIVRGDCFYSSLANLTEAMNRPGAATIVKN